MYASEKVLQMSYANYQFVLLLGFPCRSGANLRIPEGRKPSWRSSRTRPLWTSVNPGGPKFFTRVGHRPANPSHSLPQHINAVRSAVRITVEHCMFQALHDSMVLGRRNTTGESATCVDCFRNFPLPRSYEGETLCRRRCNGLQGSNVFRLVFICACASRYLSCCLSVLMPAILAITQAFANVYITS